MLRYSERCQHEHTSWPQVFQPSTDAMQGRPQSVTSMPVGASVAPAPGMFVMQGWGSVPGTGVALGGGLPSSVVRNPPASALQPPSSASLQPPPSAAMLLQVANSPEDCSDADSGKRQTLLVHCKRKPLAPNNPDVPLQGLPRPRATHRLHLDYSSSIKNNGLQQSTCRPPLKCQPPD